MPATALMTDAVALSVPATFNIAAYFIDRNLELGRGKNVATYEGGRTLTYAELSDMVNRAGNGLRSLGLQSENRVVLAMPDSAEFVAALFGAAKIGAIPVPVNPAAKPDELLYFLNDSGARALIVQEDVWAALRPLPNSPELRHVLLVSQEPARQEAANVSNNVARCKQHLFSDVLAAASARLDPEPTSKDDIAFVLYSSGSTGSPKGAVHLQRDMLVATELFARRILNISERDVCFSASKLFFAYGLGNGSYFPFSEGAAAVYNPQRPKPEKIVEYIAQFRPTLFFSVPTLYAAILQIPAPVDLNSLRLAVSAGEALPAEIFDRFSERFGVPVLDGIGSTEMLHIFIANRPDDIRPGSSGKIVPGYEAKIVNDNGKELPTGEIGNLWVKGSSAAAFYWRKHERSKHTMLGEWMVTGDKYYVDENGYYYYCGRADDMIKCGGQWISPVELENALVMHPAVLESAVVGWEDNDRLVKPKAFVVLKSGLSAPSEDELRIFLRDRVAGFKIPRWFEVVSELPKTATGKIQRFKLRSDSPSSVR